MGEKSTFRGALVESRRVVREAAARAREAMDPSVKAVRETTERIRERIHHLRPLRVDREERTVHGERCVYEVRESARGNALNGIYTILRRGGNGSSNGDSEVIGSFEVSGASMTLHSGNHSLSEIALVAAAWLEEPSPTSL